MKAGGFGAAEEVGPVEPNKGTAEAFDAAGGNAEDLAPKRDFVFDPSVEAEPKLETLGASG